MGKWLPPGHGGYRGAAPKSPTATPPKSKGAATKAKPGRTKPHHHRLDVYDADIWLATNERQWRALGKITPVAEGDPPDAAGNAAFATFHPNDGGPTAPVIVLWLDLASLHEPADLVNTCAHEASHAAGHLLEHIGQDHHGSNEAHAYLVGWLTQWLWERCQ